MTETIFIALLGEGTAVWRPVQAIRLSATDFVVLRPDDYDPDDERWEFEPGTVVHCERRVLSDGEGLAAIARARKTA